MIDVINSKENGTDRDIQLIIETHSEHFLRRLQRRIADLSLQDNVRFVNRFVEVEELCEYIGAADLYVTPYMNEEQITSGTLAYAAGAGKAGCRAYRRGR